MSQAVSMKVSFEGSAGDVLLRLTDAQIAAGIVKAENGLATAKLLALPEDPWSYENNSGPFPLSRESERLMRDPDERVVRAYQSTIDMLKGEQQRRADRRY